MSTVAQKRHFVSFERAPRCLGSLVKNTLNPGAPNLQPWTTLWHRRVCCTVCMSLLRRRLTAWSVHVGVVYGACAPRSRVVAVRVGMACSAVVAVLKHKQCGTSSSQYRDVRSGGSLSPCSIEHKGKPSFWGHSSFGSSH